MERLGGWVCYFVTSLVVMATMIDDFEISGGRGQVDYIFATSLISMVISLAYILGHFYSGCAEKCIGTLFELLVTIFTCVLWIFAISYIQNPDNALATTILSNQNSDNFKDGQEVITNANLYFFSWLCFICSIYQVSSIFRDRNAVSDKRFNYWFMITAASMILIANNSNSLSKACSENENAGNTCGRSRYAIGIGVVGMLLGFLVIGMALCNKNRFIVHLGSSFVLAVLYFFGVAILTSASGPARMMGNTYFAVWGGFAVCSMTLYDLLFDKMVPITDVDEDEVHAVGGGGVSTGHDTV